MDKPIDKHFEKLPNGKVRCRHCNREVNDQGLAKVVHLTDCSRTVRVK